ncbi:Leucine rich repeat N-terminal domain [Seminavis robusta]|uniref:Leucine rich repeat N-terminal domain n=1 Tax=Seminavis robusta TaxID=568900 RepID=A0A9N8DQN7_9STRA|nr:Leucine rich repeat N-terminal domain [Seminavis robusta]|eukprot:Sro283_g107700.1 Leucine rich repeat N-terminal domain (206) ;mRNA; r:29666-30283
MISLDFSTNNLEGTIPPEISLLSAGLQHFALRQNLGVFGELPTELDRITKLTSLMLFATSISGSLPTELGQLESLIDENHLEGPLPSGLFSQLTNLQNWQSSSNLFSGSIPTEVGLLTDLKRLEVQNNTELFGTLPRELVALRNLTSLVVKNTSLAGSIPEPLCSKMYQDHWITTAQGLLSVKVNAPVCEGTLLCGCDCALCPVN